MHLTARFAVVDGVVAFGLLLSLTRQRRNRTGVVAVALVLFGVSVWVATLAMNHPAKTPPVAPSGRTSGNVTV